MRWPEARTEEYILWQAYTRCNYPPPGFPGAPELTPWQEAKLIAFWQTDKHDGDGG